MICVYLWTHVGRALFNSRTLSSLISAGLLRDQAQLLGFGVIFFFPLVGPSGGGFI